MVHGSHKALQVRLSTSLPTSFELRCLFVEGPILYVMLYAGLVRFLHNSNIFNLYLDICIFSLFMIMFVFNCSIVLIVF